jgi:hypothetical protein
MNRGCEGTITTVGGTRAPTAPTGVRNPRKHRSHGDWIPGFASNAVSWIRPEGTLPPDPCHDFPELGQRTLTSPPAVGIRDSPATGARRIGSTTSTSKSCAPAYPLGGPCPAPSLRESDRAWTKQRVRPWRDPDVVNATDLVSVGHNSMTQFPCPDGEHGHPDQFRCATSITCRVWA